MSNRSADCNAHCWRRIAVLGFVGTGRDYWGVAVEMGIVYGLRVGGVDRWSWPDMEELPSLALPNRPFAIALDSRAEQTFSVGTGVIAVVFGDSSGVVLDTATGETVDMVDVLRIVVSPDGEQFLTISPTGALVSTERRTQRQLWNVGPPPVQTRGEQVVAMGGGRALLPDAPLGADALFLADGNVIVSWGGQLSRLDATTGERKAEGGVLEVERLGYSVWYTGWLDLDVTGRLVSTSPLGMAVWDPVTLAHISGVGGYFTDSSLVEVNSSAATYSAPTRMLGHGSGFVDEVELATGELVTRFDAGRSLRFGRSRSTTRSAASWSWVQAASRSCR